MHFKISFTACTDERQLEMMALLPLFFPFLAFSDGACLPSLEALAPAPFVLLLLF
jgi:hypothetical protein